MASDGQQVAANLVHIKRHLACCLYRVTVEVNIRLGGDLADLVHRLQHSGLIVGQDDADELGVRTQCAAHVVRIDQRLAVDRQIRQLATECFKSLAGVQHCTVFDSRGNHVIARLRQSKQRQVVAFGAAAGEDHFGGATVQQLGNLLAGMLDRRPRLLALPVDGRGIPKLLEVVRTHRLEHLGQKRAAGVVVEIDLTHHELYSSYFC